MTIINRIFMSVILLSVAGSVVGSIFLATQNLIYKHTSANFVITINKIAMLCFVIPFFAVWGIYDGSIKDFAQYDPLILVGQGTIKDAVRTAMDIIHFADVISIVWFVGLILYLLVQLIIYLRFKFMVIQHCERIEDGIWHNEFNKIKKKKGVYKGGIKLLQCPNVYQPCVAGIFKSAILIPVHLADKLSRNEIEIVLSHELTHIQKKDVPLKILTFVLSSLNWFNPLLHALKNTMFEWIEVGCDEDLTMFSNPEYRRFYVDVLVKLNEEQCRLQSCRELACFSDSKNLKSLKRRIKGIMKKNQKQSTLTKTAVLTGLFCVMACGTALAKELDAPVNSIFSNHAAVEYEENYYSCEYVDDDNPVEDDEFLFIDFDDEALEEASINNYPEDYILVFEDGTIQEESGGSNAEVKHVHTFKKANIKVHKKHSDGSCTMTTYAGKTCTDCGYKVKGEVISETNYKKCPH